MAVEKGEFVSLLGPSGCGKTTTLQMIAGFVEPSGGAIRLEGRDLLAIKPAKRGLGIVFQSYALFPHMTVAENVAFGLEMQGVAAAERTRRVGETLELVGLGAFTGRFPRQLSGGQQQRVALARALVIRPQILLLDEPLSNLDAKLREEMQIELRQIQRTVGTTTILVTHDQAEAMALSDRVVVMNHGRAEQIGPPHEAYERPATPFVANFLGRTNLVNGATVRPEKIWFAASGLAGKVRTRIFQGNHWLYQIETADGLVTVIRQNTGEAMPAEGGVTAVVLAKRGSWRGSEPSSTAMRSSLAQETKPYLLSLPALLLFGAIVIVPLVMTVLLSFHDWGQYKGIEPVFVLKNWHEVFTDSYFLEMFWRTFRIAFFVTLLAALLGAPEAYILNRMKSPWRGLFLLVILGPLLISVVARTLGWALLFGGNSGLVNKALVSMGLISAPLPFMFTETGVIVALTHVLMPYMVLAVWAALQRLDPQIENAAVALGAGPFTVLRRIVLPQVMPGILSGAIIVFALAASAFATPAIIGGRRLKVASTLAYDEFLNTLNWPLGAAVAVLLLVALVAIVVGASRLVERRYAQVFG